MKLIIVLASMINIAYAASGGISGGGGNVVSPTAPTALQDPREIRSIIKGSKELLYKFISAKYALFKTGSMDADDLRMYSVLFADNEMNLHEVMEEIKLDIPIDQACFDQKGREYDGSTFNTKTNTVCISAFTIAKKVDMFEVPVQATALVLHEFSEVAGLSDEDAISLQLEVIDELKNW